MLRLVILGAPGSGKGTISSRIVRDFGLKHLSSGDLLRSQILQKTDVGLHAQSFMQAGQLVPDNVMVKLISAELANMKDNSWLLDGFPRTRSQAEALHLHEKIDLAISLEVPHSVIVDRIKARWTHLPSGRIYNTDFSPPKVPGKDDLTGEDLIQREDDKPESVQQRLSLYEENTSPLRKFYSQMDILSEFMGSETNVIWPEISKYLERFINERNDKISTM